MPDERTPAERAVDRVRARDGRRGEVPAPRNAWIAERLERLNRKDALLRELGIIKPEGTNDD
ncbi:MAG: hypothetical protein KY464_02020 [Gemmatimonadetes bacterium]|nr:hypothetical protein [Gemmatimonadota bacterium]